MGGLGRGDGRKTRVQFPGGMFVAVKVFVPLTHRGRGLGGFFDGG